MIQGHLRRFPRFDELSDGDVRVLERTLSAQRLRKGQVLIREGDRAAGSNAAMFLVLEGAIDIVRDGRHLVTLEAGETFGEMAMLDEPERSATALVREDCELLLIPRAAFFSLLQSDPALAVKILWNMNLRLSANLRSTSSRLAVLERRLREA